MGWFTSAQQTGPISNTISSGITFGRGTPAGNTVLSDSIRTTVIVVAVAAVLIAVVVTTKKRSRGGG